MTSIEIIKSEIEKLEYKKEAAKSNDSLYRQFDKHIQRFREVLQDLERLEQLEEESANYSWELDTRNALRQENFDYQQKNLELETKVAKLENVIKLVKDTLQLEPIKLINLDNTEEYTIRFNIFHSKYSVNLTQEEYEQINEVFGNG